MLTWASVVRRIILASLVGCTSASRVSESPAAPEAAPAVEAAPGAPAVGAPAPVADPPRQACRSSAAVSSHALARAGAPIEIGERSFVSLWRGRGAETEAAIASLDDAGALTVASFPVPAPDPQALGAGAQELVIVSVAHRGTGTLVRVGLAPGGGLRPGAPKALPEVEWGWPAQVWADRSRLVLHHNLATAAQTLGGAVLYTLDLETGKVLGREALAANASVRCSPGVCLIEEALRRGDEVGPGRVRVTRRPWDGPAEVREVELASTCPGLIEVLPGVLVGAGAPWRALWSGDAAPFLREAAIDAGLAPEPTCGVARAAFPSRRHPGLLASQGRDLLRWDAAARRFGARESLPPVPHPRVTQAWHPDGVVEVSWAGGHGLAHSPSDREVRRYFEHWYFEGGQVHLLRREASGWTLADPVPLALADARGTFHEGYEPVVLRNGLHAAVLLAPRGGGDEALLQPYLAPCP